MPTITDLTGTKWIINASLTGAKMPRGYDGDSDWGQCDGYSLTFTSNGTQYTDIDWGDLDYLTEGLTYYNSSHQPVYSYANNAGINDNYRTIEIIGGTSATNSDLIDGFKTYATQILPDLSNTHGKLNNNLTFTNVGTKSINFKSGNNTYSSITISGTDGLKYNNTTIVEAPTTITVSFTNSVDTWNGQGTKIFKDYTISNGSIYVNSSDEVGSISSYNGSTTVYTDSDKLVILEYSATVNGTESCGTLTLTGGLTNTGLQSCYTEHTGELANVDKIYLDNTPVGGQGTNNFLGYTFAVSGSGTISINGADMDD